MKGSSLWKQKQTESAKSTSWILQYISHGYTSNADISSGNIVPYHLSKVSVHEEMAFKDIDNEIASNIWKNAMSTFGEKIDHHFHVQASTTNHIYVGLDESPTNVC